MNDLVDFLHTTKGLNLYKFEHYLDVYDRYLTKFRNTPVTVVEVGICEGGSLEMWRHYFGAKAKIIGVDIVDCSHIKIPGVITFRGDQGDSAFWKNFVDEIGEIDIFIDDGSHFSKDQIKTFEAIYPYISPGGFYFCEDLQTSYYKEFGGGYKKNDSFIEYAKNLIDKMNSWCSDGVNPSFVKDEITRVTYAVNFYVWMVVIEKRNMDLELHSPVMAGKSHRGADDV